MTLILKTLFDHSIEKDFTLQLNAPNMAGIPLNEVSSDRETDPADISFFEDSICDKLDSNN